MTTDAFWVCNGSDDLHQTASDFSVILVGLHVAGVILASLEREPHTRHDYRMEANAVTIKSWAAARRTVKSPENSRVRRHQLAILS